MGKKYDKKVKKNRYIYDALYGPIYLPDFIWNVISCPELQRLREVRLCNINSLCLTGGANINRYEHAIGTCYLAQICLENWPPLNPISENEIKYFLLAALLHDVVSGAFGHSIQYIEGFEHEKDFKYVITGEKGGRYQYRSLSTEPIFFGMQRELLERIGDVFKEKSLIKIMEHVEKIGEIIAGRGRFGPLINSIMDLDNIDNVFRLAYHIGLVNSGEIPLKLAKSLYIKDNKLVIKKEAIPLIEKWYDVRKKLYSFLLLNPEEFSAKCMLTEAIELAKIKERQPFSWYHVDFEVLEKLHKISFIRISFKKLISYDITSNEKLKKELDKSIIPEEFKPILKQCGIDVSSPINIEKINDDEWKIKSNKECIVKDKRKKFFIYEIHPGSRDISEIVSRLMKGELYGCIGIFSTSKIEKNDIFTSFDEKRELEDELSSIIRKFGSNFKRAMIAIHSIIDVDKTERQVIIQTEDNKTIKVGRSSKQLLIGVFFRNNDINMYKLDNIEPKKLNKFRQEVYKYLSEILYDPKLQEMKLYGEVDGCE